MYACAVKKKKTAERKMCLSRTTHGHESKKQTKRIIHAGAAKKCRNRLTPNPLKISIQGRYSKWVNGRATTEMSTILGERPAPAATEGEYMYCSLHRTLNADFPPPQKTAMQVYVQGIVFSNILHAKFTADYGPAFIVRFKRQ